MTKRQLMTIWPLIDKWLSGATLQIKVDERGVIHWENLEEDELPINNMAEFPEDYRVKPQDCDSYD